MQELRDREEVGRRAKADKVQASIGKVKEQAVVSSGSTRRQKSQNREEVYSSSQHRWPKTDLGWQAIVHRETEEHLQSGLEHVA